MDFLEELVELEGLLNSLGFRKEAYVTLLLCNSNEYLKGIHRFRTFVLNWNVFFCHRLRRIFSTGREFLKEFIDLAWIFDLA